MKRWVLAALAAALFAGAGFALGWWAHRPRLDARLYAQNRLTIIQQHLDEAEPGYVLITGDSNAELQSPSERLCGSSVVNAGLSGATTRVFRQLFARLAIPVRPRAAIVTIGTNNLNAKNTPRAPEVAARFEEDIEAIVARLRAVTDTVIVTAPPPLGRELASRFDGAAVGAYAARIADLCPRIGCRYADPFAALRDGTSGFGLPDGNRGGLHLARYRPAMRAVEADLCPK